MVANTPAVQHPGADRPHAASPPAVAPAPVTADLLFRALASEPRRRILALLAAKTAQPADPACCSPEDDVCACALVEALGLGAPTISHHMKTLIEAGLVSSEKRGTWVHYRLNPDGMERLLDELRSLGAPVTPVSASATACTVDPASARTDPEGDARS